MTNLWSCPSAVARRLQAPGSPLHSTVLLTKDKLAFYTISFFLFFFEILIFLLNNNIEVQPRTVAVSDILDKGYNNMYFELRACMRDTSTQAYGR